MNARAWAAAAVLTAAAVATIDRRSDAPAIAQRTTPIAGATPTALPTPRPLGECGVDAAIAVEPRVLDADASAAVTLTVAFDLPRGPIPDRLAVVVGPIAADLAPTVTAELTTLVATLELDRGHAVAIVRVGAPSEPLTWLTGPGAADAARATLAASPVAEATMAQWRAAVGAAADALTSSPPTLKIALLVVGDRPPLDLDATLDWLPVGQRLVDALVQNIVVNLDPSPWLSSLAVGARGRLFRLNAITRTPPQAAIVLRDGRRSIVQLNGSWLYTHALGSERWRAFAVAPEATGIHRFTDAEVIASDHVGSWSGTLAFAYGLKLHTAVNVGMWREVPLADGAHTLAFAIGTRTCRVAFDPVAVCVHRRGRADACAPFAAGLTATAAAPATATATPPGPIAPPSTTPSTAATPVGMPTATTPAPAPAVPTADFSATPAPAGAGARLWLPWTLRAPASGAAEAGGPSTVKADGS